MYFILARDRGSSDLQRFCGSLLRQSESADHGRLFRRHTSPATEKTSLATAGGPRQALRRTRHRHVPKDNRGRRRSMGTLIYVSIVSLTKEDIDKSKVNKRAIKYTEVFRWDESLEVRIEDRQREKMRKRNWPKTHCFLKTVVNAFN